MSLDSIVARLDKEACAMRTLSHLLNISTLELRDAPALQREEHLYGLAALLESCADQLHQCSGQLSDFNDHLPGGGA